METGDQLIEMARASTVVSDKLMLQSIDSTSVLMAVMMMMMMMFMMGGNNVDDDVHNLSHSK